MIREAEEFSTWRLQFRLILSGIKRSVRDNRDFSGVRIKKYDLKITKTDLTELLEVSKKNQRFHFEGNL